jgi:hypothetical protein
MESEVLYKYAEKDDSSLIRIEDAIKGEKYYCPGCKNEFILRKGQIRQHHFAHKDPSPNCTNEGYLHKTFKKYLVSMIRNKIESNSPLVMNFTCNICHRDHIGNVLNSIAHIEEEYILDGCRPDISLINKQKTVSVIIEIVDTHEPETNVINYCNKNQVVLIKIKLESMNDLENIDKKIEYPTYVYFPIKEICPVYQQQVVINYSMRTPHSNQIIRRGPRIEEIEKEFKKKQYWGMRKNYYRKKK